MLLCGIDFRTEVCGFCFKFDEFQEMVKLFVAPFSELLNIFVLERKGCLRKLLFEISIIPDR